MDDLAQIKSGYSGTQVSYQTPYKVSRIETISKHCIDIQRIGYVECIPESYRLNVGNILFSGKHGKIDPVGTDEIDPVKTA